MDVIANLSIETQALSELEQILRLGILVECDTQEGHRIDFLLHAAGDAPNKSLHIEWRRQLAAQELGFLAIDIADAL
jgi:hypothetical protein